jgi:hypothetical protein
MNRLFFLAAAAAAFSACSSTPSTAQSGSLVGPTGLAVTAAGDRDLLFIASTGTEQLRALQMCTRPNLPDGGTDPANTCPPAEDLQFLPGPMRLFPASIETGDRPLRLAGARLDLPDGGGAGGGVVLVAGADDALRIVDARNLVQAMKHLEAPQQALTLPLDAGVAADVVAANPVDGNGMDLSAPMVRAFAATTPEPGVPAQLMVLQMRLDAADAGTSVPHLDVVQRCSLDPVVPRRLAVAPGDDTAVVIADGAGDATTGGALRVKRLDIPLSSGPLQACTGTRLLAGGPVRSITLSPAWYEDGQPDHAAGEIAALIRDDGGLLFVRTIDQQKFPVPSFDYRVTGKPPMEPLYVNGLAREVTFLRSVKPNPNACQKAPCTPLWVGPSTGGVHNFNLLLAVTSSDGNTTMIDPLARRFVDSNFYTNTAALLPGVNQAPALIPTPAAGTASSTLTFAPADPNVPGHALDGWFNAGVTQALRWRILWETPLPGLERHGGTVTPGPSGTLLYRAQPADLVSWESDPLLRLGVGDVVGFAAYNVLPGSPPDCNALATELGLRFFLPIIAISADGNTLTLGTTPTTGSASGFPFTCAKFGVAAEMLTSGDHPWLVYEGSEVRGRAKNGEMFVVTGRRFNYPLDYDITKVPVASTVDTSVAFTLGGTDPTVTSLWSFVLNSGQFPQQIGDPATSQGFATQVISYTSPRATNRLFISLAGSNALLQAAPEALGVVGGLLAYR